MLRYLSGGESHGPFLTAIIEGLPAGMGLDEKQISSQLSRRQKGYGRGGRMAIEQDQARVLSGLRFNKTLGSPLTLQIKNRDWENWQEKMAATGSPPDNLEILTYPRPGHADMAGGLKYMQDDLRNILERSSARETAIRVAVGTVGRILLEHFGVSFFSHVIRIGSVAANIKPEDLPSLQGYIEQSPVRCADKVAEEKMITEIEKARSAGDTLGGVIELFVAGLPPGLGSHVHPDRRLDGRLAGALCSIQAVKGVEFGAGFAAAGSYGSQVHDPIVVDSAGRITRPSNRAGGIEGGISNGQALVVRLAMKPIPTLARSLPSVNWLTGEEASGAYERSDICAVPAAAVVAEAVAAWELAGAFLEKFGGDYFEEITASYNFYMKQVKERLGG